ncbi:hypothetical protein [Novipirellula caenicola]|uniref:Uncharacterized protein n=1 Tax=Novipirellula caenicola TaxID=1536901 RepID=A0ABP9VL74_9BACT
MRRPFWLMAATSDRQSLELASFTRIQPRPAFVRPFLPSLSQQAGDSTFIATENAHRQTDSIIIFLSPIFL